MSEREHIQPAEGQGRATGRIYWLDVARVVAILSITLNHAVNRAYSNYTNQMGEYLASPLYSSLVKAVVTVFSHLGVPLFLMISGALLLSKQMETEKDFRRFYSHNLLSLFITCEIWYAVMYWFILLVTPGQEILLQNTVPQLIWGMVKTMLFIDQVTMGSMWYIPMILCLYTVIPLFALALKKASMRVLILPTLLILATLLVNDINGFLAVQGNETYISFALSARNVFSAYMLFIFLGYWVIQGGMTRIHTAWIVLGFVFTFGGICALQFYIYSRPMDYLLDYGFTGYIICAVFTFELIRRGSGLVLFLKRSITYISEISFGIYFVHILIMSALNWYLDISVWPRSVQLAFYELVSFGGSVVIIALLSRVPVLKKYLFMIKDRKNG